MTTDLSRQPLEMTSLQIAELVKSRHADVMRSIERLSKRKIIQSPLLMKDEITNNLGFAVRREFYLFTAARKNDTYVVVAQLAPQHIGAIIDAWGKTQDALEELLKALEAFDIPDDLPPDMYLYAIRERDTGHIKLGISRDPHRRLRELQTGNSHPLELVAVRPTINRFADERAIHADAEAYRLRGEWFSAGALEFMQ